VHATLRCGALRPGPSLHTADCATNAALLAVPIGNPAIHLDVDTTQMLDAARSKLVKG
jgi:hypothetical protein